MFGFKLSLRAFAAGAAVLLLTVPARAQQTGNRRVIVALPEVFPTVPAPPGVSVPPGIRALIQPFGKRQRIVLHPDAATAETLRMALDVLHKYRQEGRVLDRVLAIRAAGALPSWTGGHEVLARRLAELRGRPIGVIQGLGRARWIEVNVDERGR